MRLSLWLTPLAVNISVNLMFVMSLSERRGSSIRYCPTLPGISSCLLSNAQVQRSRWMTAQKQDILLAICFKLAVYGWLQSIRTMFTCDFFFDLSVYGWIESPVNSAFDGVFEIFVLSGDFKRRVVVKTTNKRCMRTFKISARVRQTLAYGDTVCIWTLTHLHRHIYRHLYDIWTTKYARTRPEKTRFHVDIC